MKESQICVYIHFLNFPHSELTQEFAIQREKNGQFVLGVQHKATAIDIPVLFLFRSTNGSFRQFKSMLLSAKIAYSAITN
jgi:hypothetical protein